MKVKSLKRFLPIALSVSMAVGNIAPVFADERAYLDGDNSTESVEYYEESNLYNQDEADRAETKVTISKAEYFSVIIPKAITISGAKNDNGEYEKAYNVTVKGDISGDKYIKVESPEATLHNGGKTALTVNTNSESEIVKFLQNDGDLVEGFFNVPTSNMISGKTVEYNAQVVNKEDVKAGTYSGTTQFDIGLFYRSGNDNTSGSETDVENPIVINYGLTQNDGSFISWDELVENGDITLNGTKITAFNDSLSGSLLVKDDINYILINAFENSNLSNIDLSNLQAPTIGNWAFKNSSLKNISLPNSIEEIADWAFDGCSNLESIDLRNTNVTWLHSSLFRNCVSLETVYLPDSINVLSTDAFSGCSNLTNLNYEGTQDQWNYLTIDEGRYNLNEDLKKETSIQTITCSDGVITL